ncbi:phosphatidate cytidylyltransferase [Salinibacillus xinjiangensis]|uniref:Phosphatidate cytidylyltransferase n=1 Tax=Salinibacillus xinjiangensis TaxID=1229268 RepID=A0A6G1X385_9BACI|nr:phosphatidate cytidylyltransferase [Salinibacillus xinjiangensis]MRG85366.1 phosphatidate cytidylyltransferase [Salinibacillus xinjiangensis]
MKERVITAIIALVLFIPIVIYGGWLLQVVVYGLSSIALFELLRMRKIPTISWASLISLLLLWIVLYQGTVIHLPIVENLAKSELVMFGVLLLLAYMVLKKNTFTYDDIGFILTSILYVGMGFYFFILTREAGIEYLLYVLLIIWATDTGAYFVGRAMGKHKLWPEISPKKTIEGSVGGILLAILVAVIFQIVDPFPFSLFIVVIVTILASVVGQIGDLVESAIKRHYDVKDSGNILPGHGGILDRFDSLIFMLPFLHFIGFISI